MIASLPVWENFVLFLSQAFAAVCSRHFQSFGISRRPPLRAEGMSTTLPLFWNLSSNSKKERIDASVKLIGALERFQAEFTPQESTSEDDEEGDEDAEEGKKKGDGLDVLNAADVSYSIRRLVRGLASPRESSRLGFAVALTEVRTPRCLAMSCLNSSFLSCSYA